MAVSVGKALFGRLTDTVNEYAAAVRAVIGKRVYPAQAVQDQDYPLVAYEQTEATRDQTHGGPSGLSSHQVVVSCCALSYEAAESLGRKVIDALDGEAGTWGDVVVQGCFVEDEADAEEAVTDTDVRIWRKDLAVVLWIAR